MEKGNNCALLNAGAPPAFFQSDLRSLMRGRGATAQKSVFVVGLVSDGESIDTKFIKIAEGVEKHGGRRA